MVHTDVGHQCVGARINGKMAPLRTKLKNGDMVEIMTAAGHKPSRDWLTLAATSRARNKIKHFIHAEEKARAVDLGKRVFEKELRRFAVEKTRTGADALAAIAGEFGVTKVDDLYAAMGYGKISAKQVLTRLAGTETLEERAADSGLTAVVKRVLGTGAAENKIKVRGFDDLMVFRARCCNPIRGEAIVGYITRGKGVSVHAASCPNVVNLMYDPERRIDVEWDTVGDVSPYTVRLRIHVEDRKGILADVSTRIAGINTNIQNLEATSDEQRGSIRMTVEISDLKHLEKVIKSLKGIEGVLDVERATR
jgi:GTP pyrophosphokinase